MMKDREFIDDHNGGEVSIAIATPPMSRKIELEVSRKVGHSFYIDLRTELDREDLLWLIQSATEALIEMGA